MEITSTDGVIIDNCLFSENDYGVYAKGGYGGEEPQSNILNTIIRNSSFLNNSQGTYLGTNQRYWEN